MIAFSIRVDVGVATAALALVASMSAQHSPVPFVAKFGFSGNDEIAGIGMDLDGDGLLEVPWGGILFPGYSGPYLGYRRLLGNGDSEVVNVASTTIPAGGPFYSVFHKPLAYADVDGNGATDIFVDRSLGQAGMPRAYPDMLWLNDGFGNFSDASDRLPGNATSLGIRIEQSAVFCDIDDDGDPDLLLPHGNQGLLIYVNDGTGRFIDESASRVQGAGAAIAVLAAPVDADQDGDLDIMVADSQQPLVLYVNDGTGRFTPQQQSLPSPVVGIYPLDADGDGWDDIFTVLPVGLALSRPAQSIMTPAPAGWLPDPSALFSGGAQVGDFDGDGDKDLVGILPPAATRVGYWENTGAGFFDRTAQTPQYPQIIVDRAFQADFDGDGDLDVGFGPNFVGNQWVLSNTAREAVTVTPPTRGGSYAVDFYGQANHLQFVAFGIGRTNVAVPGVGRMYLNPNAAALVGILSFSTWSSQTLTVTIPDVPAAHGLEVAMQALDIDLTTGETWTTNAPFHIIP